MVVKMIFFILLQFLPDTLESPGKLMPEIKSYPQELIEIFDSTFFENLNSADTTSALWENYFWIKLKDELWNNKRLRDHAVKNYVERGETVFFLPVLRSPIWDELQRKRREYLISEKIKMVKDSSFKKALEEYYKHKDDLFIRYEKIPEKIAVDEDFVFFGSHCYRGSAVWFSKVGKEWFVNMLKKPDPEDSFFLGYFSLLESHTHSTGPLFLLERDSLKNISTSSFYNIYKYSIEQNSWVIGFYKEKELWDLYLHFLPFYMYSDNPNCKISKDSDFYTFISESLNKIEEITDINSDTRIGYFSQGGNYFIWWITDDFSGNSYGKVKVKFVFFDNLIKTNIPMLPFPENILSKPINLRKKRIENVNIEADTVTEKVLDSMTVYYELPWVNKPEIQSVDGLAFLVKPTSNPIYRTVHGFHVIGLTLRNTCLKIGRFFRHVFLTWPFFSSYIWTFAVTVIVSFLIGFGILKIKKLIFRK